jgi:hypothetical protein
VALLLNGAVVAGQQPPPSSLYASVSGSKEIPIAPRDARAASGTVKGRVADGMPRPFTDYVVTVRDVETGGVLGRQTMDAEGNFTVQGLTPHRFVVVELRNVRRGGVMWTGGPYVISADRATSLAMSVGYGSQTASWVMTAAAEVPTVVPLAIRSGSR